MIFNSWYRSLASNEPIVVKGKSDSGLGAVSSSTKYALECGLGAMYTSCLGASKCYSNRFSIRLPMIDRNYFGPKVSSEPCEQFIDFWNFV